MSNLPKNKDEISTSLSSTDLFFKVMHHFGDWELETSHLNRIEKSIYFDMRTLYLRLGEPLSDDIAKLERYLKCVTDEEKQALQFVLGDKFTHCPKRQAYKHQGWDLMIKAYKWKQDKTTYSNEKYKKSLESNGADNEKITQSNGQDNAQNNDKKPLSNSERQARYKEKKRMLQALSDKGVSVDDNADFWQVCEIFITNFPPTNNENLQTATQSDNESNETNNGKNGAITYNLRTYKPINQESERVSVTTDTPHAHTHTFQKSNSNEPSQTPTHHSYQKGDKPIPLPQDFEFSKDHLAKCK